MVTGIVPKNNIDNVTKALSLLFQPSDTIYVCGALKENGDRTYYAEPRMFKLAQAQFLPSHVQFCLQPLHPLENRNPRLEGSRRYSGNVTAYRNFLLESDTLSLELQQHLTTALATALPLTMAIYSGGKSVHYIFSVSDTLDFGQPGSPEASELYKQTWEGLYNEATAIARTELRLDPELQIFDESTKDSVRLARLPFGLRDNGKLQEVLYTGRLATADELMGYATYREFTNYGSSVSPDPSMTLDSFERKLAAVTSLAWLRHKFNEPQKWAQASNMYFTMFKYALWVIDNTGVPYDTLNLYLQKKVYPAIVKAGYPRNPALGVFNAYKYKGLK